MEKIIIIDDELTEEMCVVKILDYLEFNVKLEIDLAQLNAQLNLEKDKLRHDNLLNKKSNIEEMYWAKCIRKAIVIKKRWLQEGKLQIKYYDKQRKAIAKRNKNNRSKIKCSVL